MQLEKYCNDLSQNPEGIWQKDFFKDEVGYDTEISDHFAIVEEQSFWFAERNRLIEILIKSFPPPDNILFESQLTSHGFEIEFANYAFSYLVIPIFLIRALPFRLKKIFHKKTTPKMNLNHHRASNWQNKIINFFGKLEQKRFANQKFIPFGCSCIVVARKPEF